MLTFDASQTQYQFNGSGVLTAIQNRQGNRLAFSYNGAPLSAITNTEGQSTAIGYNAQNEVATITDPASRVWQYGYDGAGNLAQITDPNNGITKFSYDGSHTLTQITDPNGNYTLLGYNGSAAVTQLVRVTNTSNMTGPTYSFTYNASSTQVRDPNGHTTTYGYDGSGRVTGITDPDNHTTQMSWTGDNHVAGITLPSGAATSFSYDGNNNLTKVTLPTGASASFQYANPSFPYNPSAVTDPQGNTTSYGYNGQGLVNLVTDALGHQTSYSYNANGTLASMTDPNGHTTSYGYNGQGLLSSITYPSPLGAHSFTYYSDDLLASATDGKNQTTSYTYDALGELTKLAYADGSSVGYGYDADGNRTSLTDSTGTTSYAYNALNQQTTQTVPSSLLGNASTSYTWDGVGNLLTKADSGGTTTYTYTPEDRASTVTDPNNATTTFGYDQDGNRTQVAYPNGVTESLAYNGAGELTAIGASSGGNSLTSFTYSYINPATNQPTTLRYGVNGVSYRYDALNRLVRSSGGPYTYSYACDNAGNKTTGADARGNSVTMTYNAANELTSSAMRGSPTTTYSYDGNGNLTGSSAGLSLSYNAQDQTTSITPPGSQQLQAWYSGAGQSERVRTNVHTGGAAVYRYDVTGLTAQVAGGSTTYFTRGPAGELLSERTPSATYYYLLDGQGSVAALANSGGSVVQSYSYAPYGSAAVAGSVPNPFQWDGQYGDTGTGFYKMGARYYVPGAANWTQMDQLTGAITDPASLDRYTFVEGDPTNFFDPLGALDCGFFQGLCDAGGETLGALGNAINGDTNGGLQKIFNNANYGSVPIVQDVCSAENTVLSALASVGSLLAIGGTEGAAAFGAGATFVSSTGYFIQCFS